jgi:hypothetical protein
VPIDLQASSVPREGGARIEDVDGARQ